MRGAWIHPPALKTTICPSCGYGLEGLSDEGVCPECGRSYNQVDVILYGFGAGRQATLANVRQSGQIWRIAMLAGWALFIVWQALLAKQPSFVLLLQAFCLLPAAMFALFRTPTNHPGKSQLRLTPDGFGQYDLLEPSPMLDLQYRHLWIALAAVIGGCIGAAVWRFLPIPPAIIVSVIACFWMIAELHRGRRYRRAVADYNAGRIANIAWQLRPPRRWEDLEQYSITPAKSGGHRLQIKLRHAALRFTDNSRTVVDIELMCTPEQAEAPRTIIQQMPPGSKT